MSQSPDRRRRKAPKPESAKPEPLAFLAKYKPARGESEDPLAWLDYDPTEKAESPDLGAHGLNLMVVALPTGKVLALQLPICFEVRALSGSLVSSTPE